MATVNRTESSCGGTTRLRLFGLNIENARLADAADSIVSDAFRGRSTQIAFVNAHCINVAHTQPEYLRALSEFDRLFADGSGMAIAARSIGLKFAENVNGTDLFPALCERASESGVSIGLLGGHDGVARECAARMQSRFPDLKVAFCRHGYIKPSETESVLNDVMHSGCRILFVGMGVPKQELLIAAHKSSLRGMQTLAVGGLFDFYSGRRIRAPKFLRRTGLEWTVRLAQEPGRLGKRYLLGNPVFLTRLAARRLRGKHSVQRQI